MIAGGVGITPMMSMLRYLADTKDKRRVTLIWANRTKKDIFFWMELETLRKTMRDLRVYHLLSEEQWEGLTGVVDESLLTEVLTDEDGKAEFFLCGPPGMMHSVKRTLRKLGLPGRQIHTERFSL